MWSIQSNRQQGPQPTPAAECPIAETTRQRVLSAVEDLGYRASWQARALANRRTGMVAVVNADPYGAFAPVGSTGEWSRTSMGCSPMRDSCRSLFTPTRAIPGRSRCWTISGSMVACPLDAQPPEVLALLRRNNTPTVMLNADVDGSWTSMTFDDKRGTQLLMEHLIKLGHRRIAYNAGRRVIHHSSAIVRAGDVHGSALTDAGLEPCKQFVGPVADFVNEAVHGP